MSVEEIQSELPRLSDEDLEKVIALAFHLKNFRDSEERKIVEDRMNDKNPENWRTIEELESNLNDG